MRAIAAVFLLGIMTGLAWGVPVDADNPNGVAAAYVSGVCSGSTVLILCTDGMIWRLQRGGVSQFPEEFIWQAPEMHCPTSVPVPVAEILDWTPMTITTRSGQFYMFASGVGNQWHIVGSDSYFAPLPCTGTVPNQSSSLGGIKGLFR